MKKRTFLRLAAGLLLVGTGCAVVLPVVARVLTAHALHRAVFTGEPLHGGKTLASWIDDAGSPDAAVRAGAVSELCSFVSGESTVFAILLPGNTRIDADEVERRNSVLLSLVEDSDRTVRWEVFLHWLSILYLEGNRDLYDHVAVLGARDEYNQTRAFCQFVEHDNDVVIEALKDPDLAVQIAAVHQILSGHASGINLVLELKKLLMDQQTRSAAARIITKCYLSDDMKGALLLDQDCGDFCLDVLPRENYYIWPISQLGVAVVIDECRRAQEGGESVGSPL